MAHPLPGSTRRFELDPSSMRSRVQAGDPVDHGRRRRATAPREVEASSEGHLPARGQGSGAAAQVDDQESARWRDFLQGNPALLLFIDPSDGQILEASRAAAEFYGYQHEALVGMNVGDICGLPPAARRDWLSEAMTRSATQGDRIPHRLASGELRIVDNYAGPVRFLGRRVIQAVIHDVTDLVASEAERDRLAAAVEHADDSVVITDADARIVYVNPAFERVSGYSRSEVLGENPRILRSGVQSATFYQGMWASLTAGRTWHGELVNRRRDGTQYIEEASITPVLDARGVVANYVGVKRDVTASRAIQERLDLATGQQAAVSAMVADLVPGSTAEGTAAAICDRVLTLPGIVFASIALFVPGDRVRPLAVVGRDRVQIPSVDVASPWSPAHRARARKLRRLAARPSAIEQRGPMDSPMEGAFARLGVGSLALTGIEIDGEIRGFLQVGASPADSSHLEAILPILPAFGILAALLLRPQLGVEDRREAERRVIEHVIATRAFHPVFQPIVAMATGTVVGYEALTRFADGAPPDVRFAAAAHVGLGQELELATLEAAILAAAGLPEGTWLDLNVSSALFEKPELVGRALLNAGARGIVLEITEHERIGDYGLLRRLLSELGMHVRLAVDDTGAGFASLRHILELHPDIIKLDRTLIAGIDGDPVRRGLVAGLAHFAASAGAALIAEGIETEAERAALSALGVDLGQGYLLGKPGSVHHVRRAAFRPPRGPVGDGGRVAAKAAVDAVVHHVNAILWEADGTDERMTFVSAGATSLTGHATGRWLTEPRFWEDHIHPDDRDGVLAAIEDAIARHRHVAIEYRFRLADGSYRWFEDLIEVLSDEGSKLRLVGVMIDVTDRRRLAEALAYRAGHDRLTDLLNRQAFEEAVTLDLQTGKETLGAIFFLDLDDFKLVNDSLGHRAGDAVLRHVADRLRSSVRKTDAIARFGGDEFLVYSTAPDKETLVDLGRRVLRQIEARSVVGARPMAHPASLGIAFVMPGDTIETAIRNADLAMYAAKRAGGRTLRIFDPAMLDAAVNRLDDHVSA